MKRRGFTLVEMVTVVAISSVLAALAVNAMTQLTRLGRVNGTVGVLERMLVDARVRSMTQRCTHFVQINGVLYAPGAGAAAGAPIVPASASLVRKANCGSLNYFFETGTPQTIDRVVATAMLGESTALHNGVYLKVDLPVAWLTSADVETAAVTIGYDTGGNRQLTRDDSGNGTFTPDVATAATISLRIASEFASPTGAMLQIPTNAIAFSTRE